MRLFAGDAGIDPYTREVSDVYQDVFQEGSFIGKGIYDVDAFQQAMNGRFPENTVLSHDLLEACHARSALVSDVEFYEEYPSRYNVDVDRRHRWIRGDWQITQWLLPRVPGSDARRIANPLSVLSQWKILDNLRRSLVPVALAAACCWAIGCSCRNWAAWDRCWSLRSSRSPDCWRRWSACFASRLICRGRCICGQRPGRAAGSSARSFSPWLSAL